MSYDQYDPGGLTIEELSNQLLALQSRLASTISDVKREDGEILAKQSQILQDIDSISLSVSEFDSRIGAAESSISLQSDEINLMVREADLTGDYIVSLINLTSTTATIAADNINLVGAVTVLSDITGNLGTITAGNIYGVNLYGGTITSDTYISVGTNMTIGGQLNLGTSIAINDFKINFGDVASFDVWMGNSSEYHIDYNAFKHHFYGGVDFSGASVSGLNVTVNFG